MDDYGIVIDETQSTHQRLQARIRQLEADTVLLTAQCDTARADFQFTADLLRDILAQPQSCHHAVKAEHQRAQLNAKVRESSARIDETTAIIQAGHDDLAFRMSLTQELAYRDGLQVALEIWGG